MSDLGWIKLDRGIFDKSLKNNPVLFMFWIWCLTSAAFKECERTVDSAHYQKIMLKPGQFVFSYRKAAQTLGLSVRQVRTCVSALKNDASISTQSDTRCTVISVTNWERYQGYGCENATFGGMPPSHRRHETAFTPIIEECKESQDLEAFETFWQAYPKKRNRQQALKAWNGLCEPGRNLPQMLKAIAAFKNLPEWQKEGGRYVPMPAAWLCQQRWQDEPPASTNLGRRELSFAEAAELRGLLTRAKCVLKFDGREKFLDYCRSHNLNPREVEHGVCQSNGAFR